MSEAIQGLKIVLAANEAAGTRTLQALAAGSHQIAAVLTPQLRHEHGGAPGGGVARLAHGLGVEVISADAVTDPELGLRLGDFDLLLNVHSLYIIAEEVLRAPRIGAFNLHPGPLPRYAGLNAPSWARYRGEDEHGVTVHWMEPGIDTGAIAFQQRFPIAERDTALAISTACTRHGLILLEQLLQVAASDPAAIPRLPQDLSRREYFGREVPDAGRLSWNQPARRIINTVRAFDYHPYASPWGRLRCELDGHEVGLVKARPTRRRADAPPGTVVAAGDGFMVAAADEWVEPILLEVDGRITRAVALVTAGRVALPPAA